MVNDFQLAWNSWNMNRSVTREQSISNRTRNGVCLSVGEWKLAFKRVIKIDGTTMIIIHVLLDLTGTLIEFSLSDSRLSYDRSDSPTRCLFFRRNFPKIQWNLIGTLRWTLIVVYLTRSKARGHFTQEWMTFKWNFHHLCFLSNVTLIRYFKGTCWFKCSIRNLS